MAEVVYTTVPGKMGALLDKIRVVGVPAKVTNAWLKSVGFTSSNDGTLIGVLKHIGLIDGSAVPTDVWKQFRGAKYKEILGKAIREGYGDLYAIYPNAHDHTNTDLENVFSTSTSGGKQVISKIVSTFRALADHASFEVADEENLQISAGAVHAPVGLPPKPNVTQTASSGGPTLHIDIQVHISADAAPDQIDQIFASMAKHLYGKTS
jgi:hypothetical protein